MRSLIFLLIFLSVKASSCQKYEKLILPSEVISYFFDYRKHNYLVLPKNACTNVHSIKVSDKQKNYSFVFNVFKIEKSKVSDFTQVDAKASEELKAFERILNKNKINLVNALGFLKSFFEESESIDQVVFVKGSLSNFQGKKWSAFSTSDHHWAAETIDYSKLLVLYNNSNKTQFVSFTGKLQNGFSFPKFESYKGPYIPEYIKYNGRELTNLFDFSKKIKKETVVVESNEYNDIHGYNYISKLYAIGYRDIYWFRNSLNLWVDQGLKEKNEKGDKSVLPLESIVKLVKEKKIFPVDISNQKFYQLAHFKFGTKFVPEILRSVDYQKALISIYGKEKFNEIPERFYKFGGALIPNIDKDLIGSRQIVVFSAGRGAYHSLHLVRGALNLWGFKNVYISLNHVGEVLEALQNENFKENARIFSLFNSGKVLKR